MSNKRTDTRTTLERRADTKRNIREFLSSTLVTIAIVGSIAVSYKLGAYSQLLACSGTV